MNKNIIGVIEKAANLKQNVLLSGKHGIGKTAVIQKIFTERYGNNWLYFSAATMDPWVDFVGIPKEIQDPNGHYLELIKPKCFRDDKVCAIFFDEFNRAPKKVKNAVMELIQFKSINGHKFNNLEMIWAAINPADDQETYDVDRIDPAQLDRFQVHIEIPYEPELEYFENKYGIDGSNAVRWWSQLSPENKELVSPRRLDYAVNLIKNNFPISSYVIPTECNPSTFYKFIKGTDNRSILNKAISNNEVEKVKQLLKNPSVFADTKDIVQSNLSFMTQNDCLNAETCKTLGIKIKKEKKSASSINSNDTNYAFLNTERMNRAKKYANIIGKGGKHLFEDPTLTMHTYKSLQKKYLSRVFFQSYKRTQLDMAEGLSGVESFRYFILSMRKFYNDN